MTYKTAGIAGLGAIGQAVAKALQAERVPGLSLVGVSENNANTPAIQEFNLPNMDFDALARAADLIIECLPANAVPALMEKVFLRKKDVVIISSAALIIFPEILEHNKRSDSRIIVPSGALCGLDGVRAMKQLGITASRITTTKTPGGYKNAPYVIEKNIDLSTIKTKILLFSGNALEAAKGFPANINVAATLSLAGIGPEATQVEIWADPTANSNTHEIIVESDFSTLTCRIENRPDPANPKSSMLAAQSIIAVLQGLQSPLAVV